MTLPYALIGLSSYGLETFLDGKSHRTTLTGRTLPEQAVHDANFLARYWSRDPVVVVLLEPEKYQPERNKEDYLFRLRRHPIDRGDNHVLLKPSIQSVIELLEEHGKTPLTR